MKVVVAFIGALFFIGSLSLIGSLVGALSCRRADSLAACPRGFARDDARAQRLLEKLAHSEEGAPIARRADAAKAICFGEAPLSVVTTDAIVLMDARLDDAEAAARLGHLLSHAIEGGPDLRPGDAGCDAAVDAALRAEARSIALELRLRRALGAREPRVQFELTDAFWSAPADDREALVLVYLRAHPDGAPGIDALASAYARRCKEAR